MCGRGGRARGPGGWAGGPGGREGLERLWQRSKARGENSLPWALRSQLRTYPGSLFLTYCWDGSRSLDVTVTYKKEVNKQELPWQCERSEVSGKRVLEWIYSMRLENTLFDFWILRRVQTKRLILSGNSECPGERRLPERDRSGLLGPVSLYPWKWGAPEEHGPRGVTVSSQGEVGVITTGGQSGHSGCPGSPSPGCWRTGDGAE